MLPEKAKQKGDAAFQIYDIINVGEVRIPRGTNLLTFSWNGTLPGKSRRNASYVKSQYWQSPEEIQNIWERWRKEGTKIRLMVTETPINHDVYLDGYTAEATGGNGDYEYTISFIEAKDYRGLYSKRAKHQTKGTDKCDKLVNQASGTKSRGQDLYR
jgi:hypothetical protein